MNDTLFHLASLSAKVALLGGIAWLQLFLLRRAPAQSRSRLCRLAFIAILLLVVGEFVHPTWMVKTPVFTFAGNSTGAAAASGTASIMSIISILWLLGSGVSLLRLAAGRIVIGKVRRRSMLQDREGEVEIRMADVQTPVLVGLLRPAILLPPAAEAWTAQQRRMVLVHELTHFQQRDCWTNLLAQSLRAALWFHPVLWWLASQLSREQELTCDEAVIASGHSPHDYAGFLLDTVRDLRSTELLSCGMAGSGANSVKQRFANLVAPLPRTASRRLVIGSLAAFAVAAVSLTAIRPVWSQTQKHERPEVYTVGGDVLPPKLLSKTSPEYTPEAKAARIEGRVVLKTTITAEGTADDVEVISGIDPGLDQKAIQSVLQWTFQPGTKDGKAVAVKATIEINFRLK